MGRGGLRVVLRVAEGDQASYRSARRAVFDHPRVDPDAVLRAVAVLGATGDRRVGRGGPVVTRSWLVLAVAVVLPGMGHVLLRMPVRGLMFAFYTVLLGVITWQLTTPEISLVGRLAGGLFVYAISLLDAYTWATRRFVRSNVISQQ